MGRWAVGMRVDERVAEVGQKMVEGIGFGRVGRRAVWSGNMNAVVP